MKRFLIWRQAAPAYPSGVQLGVFTSLSNATPLIFDVHIPTAQQSPRLGKTRDR